MIKITLKGEFCSLNEYIKIERTKKEMAANIKRNETYRVWGEVLSNNYLRTEKPVFILSVWYVRNKKKDKDNISFAKKFILDGLVQARVIKSDNWETIIGFADFFRIDTKNPRVEINLAENKKEVLDLFKKLNDQSR